MLGEKKWQILFIENWKQKNVFTCLIGLHVHIYTTNNYKPVWNNGCKNKTTIQSLILVFCEVDQRKRRRREKNTTEKYVECRKVLWRQIQTNFKSTGCLCRLENHCQRYACQIERLNDLTFFHATYNTATHTCMHACTEPTNVQSSVVN